MDNVKYGIVGLGNMGRAHRENILSGKVKGVDLTAICDVSGSLPDKIEGESQFTDVDEMINSTYQCYTNEYANIHRGNYELSSKLTKKFEDARLKVAEYLNVSFKNIIFVKSATEGINLVSSSLSSSYFNDEDEVIISYLEHHANIIPWHLSHKKIKIVPLEINNEGEIDYHDLKEKINSKTKLISLTHMSNVTGSITDFQRIKELSKNHNIPLLLDGCQYAPHRKVNLKDLDPDFYVFSAHKLYGPSGLGILYIKDKWLELFSPYQGGGSMIKDVEINKSTYASGFEKFEAGTPPIAQVIGFSAAIDFLQSLGMKEIFSYEQKPTYKFNFSYCNNLWTFFTNLFN